MKAKNEALNCLYCEKEIVQKRNTKKYCNSKCRVYANRVPSNIARAENIIVNKKGHLVREALDKPVIIETKVYDFCKHSAVKGLCKKGCR